MASNKNVEAWVREDQMIQNSNKAIVDTLYKALAEGERSSLVKMVASDVEWWFHGPPRCEHMMRKLTGESNHREFRFEPRSMEVVGDDCVIAEGWEGAQVYWVHVWTLKDGLITQLREYFNTWLTVRDVKPPGSGRSEIGHLTLWQSLSHPRDLPLRSLPGLVLAL